MNFIRILGLGKIHGIRTCAQHYYVATEANSGYSQFYGHNAIWRTEVLRAIGGGLEYHKGQAVIVEDLSLSLRVMQHGYHGWYSWLPLGEWGPGSLREVESMWLRWIKGAYQVHFMGLAQPANPQRFLKKTFTRWKKLLKYINLGLIPLYLVLDRNHERKCPLYQNCRMV